MNAIRAVHHLGRSQPLSTLLAAREEDLRRALPGWSVPNATSGVWRREEAPRAEAPREIPTVDFVRLDSLPYVRFTAPSFARVCEALALPEVDEPSGDHVLAFADVSRGGASELGASKSFPIAGDLHVIERVSDLVRDSLAWTQPEDAMRFLEEDATRARAAHEERLSAWLARPHRGAAEVAPAPPPPLRIPLEAILELAKDAAHKGLPLWLWSVRWAD